MGKRLTQQEIDFILSAKAAGVPTGSICQMTGRPRSTVNYAQAKYGEAPTAPVDARTHTGWTAEEDAIITGHPEMNATEISELLPGRTANACRNRRRRMQEREDAQPPEQAIDTSTARGRVKQFLLWLLDRMGE